MDEIAVGCRLGGRRVTTLVASTSDTILLFFDSRAQKPWVDPFPYSVCHFGAIWQQFWIYKDLKEGIIESKNLFCKS